MGYSTKFVGDFSLSRPLTPDEIASLQTLYEHRHEEDEPLPYALAGERPVPIERTLKLRVYYGEEPDIDSKKFPSYYCQWVISPDRRALVWDGKEEFYCYVGWLQYLVSHFFAPWGVELKGMVWWKGDKRGDRGTIDVKKDKIVVKTPGFNPPKCMLGPLAW